MLGNFNLSLRLNLKEFWIFSQANLFVNIIWYSGIFFFFWIKENRNAHKPKCFRSQAEKKTEFGYDALDHILVLRFCTWSPWCLGRYIWQDLPWPGVHVHSVPVPLKQFGKSQMVTKLKLRGRLCTPTTCVLVRKPDREDSFMSLSCRRRCSLQWLNRDSLA